jgi:hypothetical protein
LAETVVVIDVFCWTVTVILPEPAARAATCADWPDALAAPRTVPLRTTLLVPEGEVGLLLPQAAAPRAAAVTTMTPRTSHLFSLSRIVGSSL